MSKLEKLREENRQLKDELEAERLKRENMVMKEQLRQRKLVPPIPGVTHIPTVFEPQRYMNYPYTTWCASGTNVAGDPVIWLNRVAPEGTITYDVSAGTT